VARGRFGSLSTCVTVSIVKDMVWENNGRAVESGKMLTRDFDVAGGVEVAVAVAIKRVSRRIGYSIARMDNFFKEILGV
jgi:hypothetical protein